MVYLTDNAGLHFVVGTSDRILSQEDRKLVRSHARRAQGKRRKAIQLQSWIDSKDKPGHVQIPDSQFSSSTIGLNRINGDFCTLQLPTGVEPSTIQELVKGTQHSLILKHMIRPMDTRG